MKKYWQVWVLALVVVAFWFPIFFNNSFQGDEGTLIQVFKTQGLTWQYLLTPHNEHFMPMFKLFFFIQYKLFGTNITVAMLLNILMHIVNVVLFYFLCGKIFPRARWRPFLLSLLFAVNSAYFEVLHWFFIINTAGVLFFLQVSLLSLHEYMQAKKSWLYYLSLFSAFMIPMNFSLGFLGLFLIWLYYFGIIKRSFKVTSKDIKLLWPYAALWLIFFLIYYAFVVFNPFGPAAVERFKPSFNLSVSLQFLLLGFMGALIKSAGFGLGGYAINIALALVFIFFGFFLLVFFSLYFFLTPKKDRVPIMGDRGIAAFALFGLVSSYMALAFTRTQVGADAFLSWGRYHYFPVFFMTIFLGNMQPSWLKILDKVYNPRRVRILGLILIILFMLSQWLLIYAKCFSSIRLEG